MTLFNLKGGIMKGVLGFLGCVLLFFNFVVPVLVVVVFLTAGFFISRVTWEIRALCFVVAIVLII